MKKCSPATRSGAGQPAAIAAIGSELVLLAMIAGAGQIARVTRFIAQHYREPLDVRAIADHAKLHPKYLMRVFRKQSGASIWEYLLRLRVSHAQRLLITTDLKVLDVAMESGFSSVAPFYAAFARHSAGLRPLEYRHRHRPATEAAPPPLFP